MAGYLACDIGQAGARFRIRSDRGVVDVDGPAITLDLPLVPQWAAVLRAVLAEHRTHEVDTVLLGSPGAEGDPAPALLAALDAPVTTVAVAHEAVTGYLGALGLTTGCVITASVGTSCLAVGPRETARVDGWGYLMGDAGSAFWIGRTALEAAMRGYDGRRQMTELTGMLAGEYPDLESAYLALLTAGDRVDRVAAFAARVDELAGTDRVAGNILDKAAAHLSEAVQAAIRRVNLHRPKPPRVVALGGVFCSHRVLSRFTDYLTLQWPSFALTEATGTALDGVELLLGLPDDHPAGRLISVARR